MQIHELNNFAGTPTSSDYLAIDNSTTTTKIGATGLGVQDKLTVAEANTGTSTASRIVTPKVVHDYVTGEVSDGIDNILTSATETKWAGITGGDGSINNILDYQSDQFITDEFGCGSGISLTAGSIGTAATTKTVDVSKTGYVPISATFSQYSHPSGYNASLSLTGNNLGFIFFRSSSSAYSVPTNDLKALVLYKKAVTS